MKEFQLIREIQHLCSDGTGGNAGFGVELGIGDDAAVLEIPNGHHLVAATDTLNAGTHFPLDTSPFDIGFKCLAVNLSDLAAMGAVPHWALLSLSLPGADSSWIESFIAGFKSLAQPYGVSLVGGDTTSGPMSISLTALGSIKPGLQMQRNGAKQGDLLVVSGTLGGAAYALDLLQKGQHAPERDLLDRPQPRVELGQFLAPYANACIDVSDGLLADLGHILKASVCGASLEVDKLPQPACFSALPAKKKWDYQLSGGDDYELLFTLPRSYRDQVPVWSEELNIGLSIIGEIKPGQGVRCVGPDGDDYKPDHTGFEHFGESV